MTSTENTLVIHKEGKTSHAWPSTRVIWEALGYKSTGDYLHHLDGIRMSLVDMSYNAKGYKPAVSVELRSVSTQRFRRVTCLSVTRELATVPLDKVRAAFEELRVKEQEATQVRHEQHEATQARIAQTATLERALKTPCYNARLFWYGITETLALTVHGVAPEQAGLLMDCLKTFREPRHTPLFADPTVCCYCGERINEVGA